MFQQNQACFSLESIVTTAGKEKRPRLPRRKPLRDGGVWHAVVEQSEEGFIVIDSTGRISAVNPAAAAYLGRGMGALLGRPYSRVCSDVFRDAGAPAEGERLAGLIRQGLHGGAVKPHDISLPLPGGGLRRYTVKASPLRLGLDITPMLLLRLTVKQDASDVAALQRRIIDSAAHELRTPLTAIHGFLDLLQKDGARLTAEQREECLLIMRENVDELRALVEKALREASLSVEGGCLEPVNLSATVREVIRILGRQIADRRLNLHLDLPVTLGPVPGDRNRLREMVYQIVANGVKYSEPERSLIIRGCHEGRFAILHFEDEGPGIPGSELQLVFEPLFRGEEAAKSGIPGAGLGLSLAKKIAVQHGGAIWVQSREKAGAVFTVRLPLEGCPGALGEEDPGGR